MKSPLTEEELQAKIAELILNEHFIEVIEGKEQLEKRITGENVKDFLPDFSIDFLTNYKYNEGALKVIDSLYMLELITGEKPRNISLKKHGTGRSERLYPDFVASNVESNQFILFELKKDGQTEREAITELLAYALELKNHLPNIADGDVLLIVIANNFETLLDHAIISIVLGTHYNILALKTEYDDDLRLRIHYPQAWTDIWQNKLPVDVFTSITIVPYKDEEKEGVPHDMVLIDAVGDIILQTATKVNSQGFYIAWENCSSFGSNASFCISLYQFNPFVFLKASLENGFVLNEKEPLSQYILKHNEEWGDSVYPESMMEIYSAAKSFLDLYFSTSLENFSSWTYQSSPGSNFRSQAWPLTFNAWGNLGDFLRKYFYHPALRNGFFSQQELETAHMHRSPMFGIEMINRISDNSLFTDGSFRPKGIYFYMKQLREYLEISNYYIKLNKEKPTQKMPRLYFAALDLLSSTREIQHRIHSVEGFDDKNIPPLPIYFGNVPETIETEVLDWKNWFNSVFLSDNPLYQVFTTRSFDWCLLYAESFEALLDPKQKKYLENDLVNFCKSYLTNLLVELFIDESKIIGEANHQFLLDLYFDGNNVQFDSKEEVDHFISEKKDNFWLSSFEIEFLELMDRSSIEVFHILTDMPTSIKDKDWSVLQERAIQRFREGRKYITISVSPSGEICINELPKEHQVMGPIKDPEKEIFLEMNQSGYLYTRKVTWDEIKSGDLFFFGPNEEHDE